MRSQKLIYTAKQVDTQVYVGILAILTTVSALLAWWNIKRLQIDQHRAWMLRCWFYAGNIITLRLIQLCSYLLLGRNISNTFHSVMPCDEITYLGGNASVYPNCAADPSGYTSVQADATTPMGVEEVVSSLNLSFGTAGIIALWMHAVGIEIYLRLTPAEGERLRQVSYEKQLEKGHSKPGSSGLTADRLGDARRWMPSEDKPQKSGVPSNDGDGYALVENPRQSWE
jgi:hypothetical protein